MAKKKLLPKRTEEEIEVDAIRKGLEKNGLPGDLFFKGYDIPVPEDDDETDPNQDPSKGDQWKKYKQKGKTIRI